MSEARTAIEQLLSERGDGKTICPSEAARRLAGTCDNWRDYMDPVHFAVDEMLGEGRIAISWKGAGLSQRSGPYRISDAGE